MSIAMSMCRGPKTGFVDDRGNGLLTKLIGERDSTGVAMVRG